MKIHITSTYNAPGTPGIAQHKVVEIARELGFRELGIYKYPTNVDSDRELGTRIDGIIASLQYGDIVFIQSPTWNGERFDLRFVRKLKAYKGVKIVIFVHDLVTFLGNYGIEHLRKTIEFFNYADLIIVPSKAMLELLQQNGLTVKKQMIQELFDYPIDYELNSPKFVKRLFFTGGPNRFPFLGDWKYQTQLALYSDQPLSTEGHNLEIRGYQKETRLLSELSEGGYGLVWPSAEADEYYHMLQPYKVGNFLAAGIPVIIKKGLAPEQVILKNGLGFAVESLEEADAIVQATGETEYNQMIQRISEFNKLIKNGWFTKKMLTDAVMLLLNNHTN